MKTYTEIVRLESITKSPVVSLFSETLNGVTTIRAFNKEDYFLKVFFICVSFSQQKLKKRNILKILMKMSKIKLSKPDYPGGSL